MQIRRIGYALGAEVRGLDVRSLDENAVPAIRQAWLEHHVLCFPDQKLAKSDLIAFAARFGEVEDNKKILGTDPDNAQVLLLTNKPFDGKPWDGFRQGETWHSDSSHRTQPNLGTFVYARELPEAGGTTMFANQYMAYETLSPLMRRILDGLDAVHDHSRVSGLPAVVHPAVKIHPETGRKALYVGNRVRQFVGMTEEESKPLLDFLLAHAVRYEFTYRHNYRVDDLIMWDNRCLMHIAPADYDLARPSRMLWRCSLLAEATGRVYDPQAELASAGGAR